MTFLHGFVFFIQKVSLQEQKSFLAFVSAGKRRRKHIYHKTNKQKRKKINALLSTI